MPGDLALRDRLRFALRDLRKRVYDAVRPFVVRDLDPNEDFVCGHCGKPVLTRTLFCSTACAREDGQEAEEWLRALLPPGHHPPADLRDRASAPPRIPEGAITDAMYRSNLVEVCRLADERGHVDVYDAQGNKRLVIWGRGRAP